MISQKAIDEVKAHEEWGRITFYFLAYTNNREAVTVIDLSNMTSYEREDWDTVNDVNMSDRDEAIAYGRDFADRHGLHYELFESRYDRTENEKLY